MIRFVLRALSLASILVVLCPAAGQDEFSAPLVRRIRSSTERAEAMLARGDHLGALRLSHATHQFLWDHVDELMDSLSDLWNPLTTVKAIAIVRLGGTRDGGGYPSADRRTELESAEVALEDLRQFADPRWDGRHGESLVAVGRTAEAYLLLVGLHRRSAISEPEVDQALFVAANATGHPDVAREALEACIALARRRAGYVCAHP